MENENTKTIAELTSLADNLISLGHMEAYQLNHVQIYELLDEMQPKVKEKSETKQYDMFGDELLSSSSSGSKTIFLNFDFRFISIRDSYNKQILNFLALLTTKTSIAPGLSLEKITMWEYRFLSEFENSTLHGPVPNLKMIEMFKTNQFKEGDMARRVGTDNFYDIKRIDFDLYQ